MNLKIIIADDKKTFDYAIQIRHIVFEVEQHFKDEFDDIDKFAHHAAVFDDDKLIGCGRIYIDENQNCHIGRIAVIKEYRGKDVGSFIVTELEKFALNNLEFNEYVLSAQTRAKGFYTKLGYIERGEIYFEEYCEHIEMFKSR